LALITGASAGIGAELARVFSQRGHRLVLTARRQDRLDALADEIAATGQERPDVIALDLGAPGGATALVGALAERRLTPHVLVNNAGFGLVGAAESLDPAEQLAMVDLNIRALTELSLALLPSLVRGRGLLLNVASVAGFMPGPGMAVYYASKAFVLSFSEALHAELAPKGVRVTALCPGPVLTEFQARAGMTVTQAMSIATVSAREVAEQGYRGLMAGRRVVVPGWPSKIFTMLPRLMPRAVILALIAQVQFRKLRKN
jgi:short-subunit dehydrogenase